MKRVTIRFSIAILVTAILGGLSYRLYSQWRDVGELSKQIQALPTATLTPKSQVPTTATPIPKPVDPDKKIALEKDRIALENSITGTIVQALGGLFFFTTIFFTWQNLVVAQANLRVAKEKNDQDSQKALKDFELAESRLITERFTKAVEQLGSDKIEVRLGGIYSLERIAKDSPNDHWTVIEVLTSFIRNRSPIAAIEKAGTKTLVQVALEEQNQLQLEKQFTPITTDVQAALTVISRRDTTREREEHKIDLSFANLTEANLYRANLQGVNLYRANLQGANLYGTNLQANLIETQMQEADFVATNLKGANLMKSNLQKARLIGAVDLRGAYLVEAQLQGTCFRGAQLQGVDFTGAQMQESIFEGSQLQEANFTGAQLQRARFTGSQLQEAVFHAANLQEADLRETNIQGTSFITAILLQADLERAVGLTDEQLNLALLCETILPDGTLGDDGCEKAKQMGYIID